MSAEELGEGQGDKAWDGGQESRHRNGSGRAWGLSYYHEQLFKSERATFKGHCKSKAEADGECPPAPLSASLK